MKTAALLQHIYCGIRTRTLRGGKYIYSSYLYSASSILLCYLYSTTFI